MSQAEGTQQNEAMRLVAQWPGAWLLDQEGVVIAHGPVPPMLARLLTKDERGKVFFGAIVPSDQAQRLAGTFHVAMEHGDTVLDLDEALRLTVAGVPMDVRIRLRRVDGLGAATALAVLEDDTSRKTLERALAAALGETGDQSLRDGETGLFGLRQRLVFLRLGSVGFLIDFAGLQADLGQHQRHLGTGKLFTLGTKQAQLQQLDLLIFQLNDPGKTRIFCLQIGDDLACGKRYCIVSNHFLCKWL